MSNSAITFRQFVISWLHANGFNIFGGAVRDIVSGEFFSPEWSGDIDAISYCHSDKIGRLVMSLLHPNTSIKVVSVEQLAENLTRLIISDMESNKLQLDLVNGKINSYNYGCGFADAEDERDFLDLDVNGLQLGASGIFLRNDTSDNKLNLLDVLVNIQKKKFRVLKALNDKRIIKMRKLEAAGWTQVD